MADNVREEGVKNCFLGGMAQHKAVDGRGGKPEVPGARAVDGKRRVPGARRHVLEAKCLL